MNLRPGGLHLTHVCFDGAVYGALIRLYEQLRHVELQKIADVGKRNLADLQNMDCDNRCAHHDVAGGIRWAGYTILPQYAESRRGFLKIIYNCSRSLREGYEKMTRHSMRLYELIEFTDRTRGTLEERTQLWKFLGLDDVMARDAGVCDLHVRAGRIYCRSEAKSWPDYYNRIIGVYQATWRFELFSSTRFTKLCPYLRSITTAFLIGTHIYVNRLIELRIDASE